MANWGEDELNAALSVHPRIGEKPTGGAHRRCRAEQSAVDSENERLAQALRRNARYEARFGRVF